MLAKAKIIVVNSKQEISVMYNPTDLSISKSVSYSGEGINLQFNELKEDNLTVALFFDTYEQGIDVRGETKKIEALLNPQTGHGEQKMPPICLFTWSNVWYKGVITQLDQKFTLFLSSGIPVRAELNVTFKSVPTEEEQLEALGLWNCRRLWTVTSATRLDLLAYETLGDSSLWRLIAKENNIANPLAFPAITDIGKTIVIPDIHQQA